MKKPKVKHLIKGFNRSLLAGLKPQLPNSLLIVYTNHPMIKTAEMSGTINGDLPHRDTVVMQIRHFLRSFSPVSSNDQKSPI